MILKKTKIIATIGPSSQSEEMLEKMVQAGMNVARLNFSHNEHSWHNEIIQRVRRISKKVGVSVGVIADLQGPRIRTMTEKDLILSEGELVLISDCANAKDFKFPQNGFAGDAGGSEIDRKRFLLDAENITEDISVGNEILIEDGSIRVTVKEKSGSVLLGEVAVGGTVKNHKGVNIPGAKLRISPITEKDQRDLEFSVKAGVDFVALSFVSTAADIKDLRDRIKVILGRDNDLPQIVAKIERKEAIDNLQEILDATDAVMVARGDLGIELDESRVVVLQKEIIAEALTRGKPVIVATQMLNSMIENPRPTRAEVSDVSNAVIDHADAVMLSGETANGKYPLETVKKMSEIIANTEASPFDDVAGAIELTVQSEYTTITRSAYELARSFDVASIILATVSGFSARLMSHFRPQQQLVVATSRQMTYSQLSLVWGIDPYLFEGEEDADVMIAKVIEEGKKKELLKVGQRAVIISGRTEKEPRMHLLGIKEIE